MNTILSASANLAAATFVLGETGERLLHTASDHEVYAMEG